MNRLRRLRATPAIRDLVAETRLDASKLVLPIFVHDDITEREALSSLPGHYRWPSAEVGEIAKEAEAVGIQAVLIFGVPSSKSLDRAYASDGPTQRAIQAIRSASPSLAIFADTCLCSFTETGHCGIVRDGAIDNDESIEMIARVAVSQAKAGADFVSPSDMMDGRVGAIRSALDAEGLPTAGILSYAAKYASAFYGPFRDVAESTPMFGDRRGYQLDPRSSEQGLRSIERDIDEGADMVLVKPALSYLDVIARASERFDVPIGAYNVSGEFAMIKAAAERGWLDEQAATTEALTAIFRAGARFVITYHALDIARLMHER
ncbi:MAG: porphobilinogen synthase [Actinomycetota bacterium]